MAEFLTSTTQLPAADQRLVEAYADAGRTLDDLPYTDEFEQIFRSVSGLSQGDRADVFRRLHNIRKAGRLPRLGRGASLPPKVPPEAEDLLASLVTDVLGSLGQRDRLPYTPEFDKIHARFQREARIEVTEHDLWRLIARIAKS